MKKIQIVCMHKGFHQFFETHETSISVFDDNDTVKVFEYHKGREHSSTMVGRFFRPASVKIMPYDPKEQSKAHAAQLSEPQNQLSSNIADPFTVAAMEHPSTQEPDRSLLTVRKPPKVKKAKKQTPQQQEEVDGVVYGSQIKLPNFIILPAEDAPKPTRPLPKISMGETDAPLIRHPGPGTLVLPEGWQEARQAIEEYKAKGLLTAGIGDKG